MEKNIPQEQVFPFDMLFSVDAFSQEHCIAGLAPQEHVASFAQAHPEPSDRPQQVDGLAVEDIFGRM